MTFSSPNTQDMMMSWTLIKGNVVLRSNLKKCEVSQHKMLYTEPNKLF